MVYKARAGETVALQNANLTVGAGEFISLIGPSGCGKTTLLRLIADLIELTSGELRVAGKTPRAAREAREYGYVFQAPVLYEWRTVIKNVMLPLEIMRFPKAEQRARASNPTELVGLEDFHKQYPFQLSGGMQQRVSIARASSLRPQTLADGRTLWSVGRNHPREHERANSSAYLARNAQNRRVRDALDFRGGLFVVADCGDDAAPRQD